MTKIKTMSPIPITSGTSPATKRARRSAPGPRSLPDREEQARADRPTPKAHQGSGRPLPLRVQLRPSVKDWSSTELCSLEEAAALMWPDGFLSVASLRTAVRDGILEVAEIAGKVLTNKAALERMSICRPRRGHVADVPTVEPTAAPHRLSDREILRSFKPD